VRVRETDTRATEERLATEQTLQLLDEQAAGSFAASTFAMSVSPPIEGTSTSGMNRLVTEGV